MSTPNDALRAVRLGLGFSQDDLARRVGASKRLVQRWESGQTRNPQPRYIRALEELTGLPANHLGFSAVPVPDGRGGHDMVAEPIVVAGGPPLGMPAQLAAERSNFSGIWLSRYEYFSSGRAQTFVGLHYVAVLQHGDRLTVRSLPNGSSNPDSPLTMDLRLRGSVVTGTWVEQTAPGGYYKGAQYDGAVQMLVEPTGRRMVGKWVGFGSEMDVNTGPWELIFQDASMSKATMEQYSRPPE